MKSKKKNFTIVAAILVVFDLLCISCMPACR